MNDLRHELQHASGALEVVQRRPVLIEAIENLRVNRISMLQALEIMTVLRLRREVRSAGRVEVRVGAADLLRGEFVVDLREQAPTDDLECLLRRHRLPQSL